MANAVNTTIATIFIKKPARIMSEMVRTPDEKTIAFGGVATGSIKAQLAASVTGTQSTSGSIPDEAAIAAITGSNVAVVARLLVSSVKKTTSPAAATTSTSIPILVSGVRLSPSQTASPEFET